MSFIKRHAVARKKHSSAEEETLLRASLGHQAQAAKTIDWWQLGSMNEPMVYLGEGEFATAHRTTLNGKTVAVKMLKKTKQDQTSALKGIKREIMLMTLMSQRHPNVLQSARNSPLDQLSMKSSRITHTISRIRRAQLMALVCTMASHSSLLRCSPPF